MKTKTTPLELKKPRVVKAPREKVLRLGKDFAVFVIANGRPENCPTMSTLKASGYTGRVILLLDDMDQTREGYEKAFGKDNIITFDKKDIARRYPAGDNLPGMHAVYYARNACFEVAKRLGLKTFIQLDDDYTRFDYRIDSQGNFCRQRKVKNLDEVFAVMVHYFNTAKLDAFALGQGGDYIGGTDATFLKNWILLRKVMNSWICSTERPFHFFGRLNEDVNTYVRHGSLGLKMFSILHVALAQRPTQLSAGGMTEVYKSLGTYAKSFYTVMWQPSSVKIASLGFSHPRIHHRISWRNTAPLVVAEMHRK